MKLSDVSQAFDDEGFSDAYYPTILSFYGQTDVYDGSKRDGTTVVRRVLAVAPGTVIPARGALYSEAGSINYIVGLRVPDTFRGSAVREKYIMQRADHLATIQTTLQTLQGAGGVQAYTGLVWLKNTKDERVTSESYPLYNLYFSSTESLISGQIIEANSKLYRVKVVTSPASGLQVAECFEFKSLTETITYTPSSTTKDEVTDTYPAGTPSSITGLRERYLSYYDNPDAGKVKYEPGDILVSIQQSDVASPVLQDFVTLDSVDWNVMDFDDPGDSTWALHLRRK